MRVGFIVFCSIALAATSSAQAVTFSFTGKITSVSNNNQPQGLPDESGFDGTIHVGNTCQYSFTLDASTPNSGSPGFPQYSDHSSLAKMIFTAGDYNVSGTTYVDVSGWHDRPTYHDDQFEIHSGADSANELNTVTAHIGLSKDTPTALTSFGLPPTGPGMSDMSQWGYPGNTSYVIFEAYSSKISAFTYFYASVDTIHVVPEPASIVVLALGAVALLRRPRKRPTVTL